MNKRPYLLMFGAVAVGAVAIIAAVDDWAIRLVWAAVLGVAGYGIGATLEQ